MNNCTNCGAPPRQSGPDVRKGHCEFCGVDYSVTISSDQLAAAMALDTRNAEEMMRQLARALGHAFGQRTKIEWDAGRITKVSLDLGKEMYVAVLEVDVVAGQKKKMVRGVALKTMHKPIEEWIVDLHAAIAEHANTNAKAHAALAQLRLS
ncbi:MAG TPA: hypothetical protein VGM39_15010 [Kofleriaceae bacterium]|jgi:hypothetical protein